MFDGKQQNSPALKKRKHDELNSKLNAYSKLVCLKIIIIIEIKPCISKRRLLLNGVVGWCSGGFVKVDAVS